jgi:hypothetical protein
LQEIRVDRQPFGIELFEQLELEVGAAHVHTRLGSRARASSPAMSGRTSDAACHADTSDNAAREIAALPVAHVVLCTAR